MFTILTPVYFFSRWSHEVSALWRTCWVHRMLPVCAPELHLCTRPLQPHSLSLSLALLSICFSIGKERRAGVIWPKEKRRWRVSRGHRSREPPSSRSHRRTTLHQFKGVNGNLSIRYHAFCSWSVNSCRSKQLPQQLWLWFELHAATNMQLW